MSFRIIAAAGTAASAVVVTALTRAGAGSDVVVPDGPLGVWRSAEGLAYPVTALIGTFAFVLCFLALYRLAARGEVSAAQVAIAAVLWCAPVLAGPPLLSLDAYSYAAQGVLTARGLDPFLLGPSALGADPLVAAVAPIWRDTPAPYGPLTVAILRWVAGATGGGLVPIVLVLRVLVCAAIVACGLLAVRIARPGEAAVALVLVLANPVTVFHLAGGVHLDALLGACAGLAVLAVRRGHWGWAAFAAATALALKLPGIVLAGYVLAARIHPGRDRRIAGGLLVLAILGAATLAYSVLIPDGFGWVRVLDTPGKVRMFYAIPTILGGLGYGLAHLFGSAVPFATTLTWARTACAVMGGLAILGLLFRAYTDPAWRRPAAAVGTALVVLAVAAPAVHAWYLVWGLVPLACAATMAGRRPILLLCVATSFSAMPRTIQHGPGLALTLVLLVLAVAAAVAVTAARRPGPATSGIQHGVALVGAPAVGARLE